MIYIFCFFFSENKQLTSPVFEFEWESSISEAFLKIKIGAGVSGETWKAVWKSKEVTEKKLALQTLAVNGPQPATQAQIEYIKQELQQIM